jgi:hypothetical protein
LDDDEYIFIVEARFRDLKTQNRNSRHFYVKALQSPAIYVFPRQQSISTDTAKLIIKGQNLTKSYGIAITFSTDFPIEANQLEVNQIYGLDDPKIEFKYTNKQTYLMVLGGEPLKGNCDLMSVVFPVSGIHKDSLKVDIETCNVWDSAKVDIDLGMVRGGLLIKETSFVF